VLASLMVAVALAGSGDLESYVAGPVLVQRAGRAYSLDRRAVRLTAEQRRMLRRTPHRQVLRSPDTRGWRLVHRLAALRAAAPPGALPRGEDSRGRLRYTRDWMAGFWAGALWQAHDLTRARITRRWAVRATADTSGYERMDSHDVGFIHSDSVVAAHDRLCPGHERCARWRASALRATDTLVELAGPAGTIVTSSRRCRRCAPGERETIIDSAMNAQLLVWAWRQTGIARYREVAATHLRRLAELLVRPDGSTAQAAYAGTRVRIGTRQGLRADSTWSRGQAWAIYGYAAAAAELADPQLLATARALASWWHERLPGGGVPRWDFDAASGPRDVSAATIAAAGLARLAELEPPNAAAAWRLLGRRLLRNAERRMARGMPLGRLRGQVYTYGGSRWDENAEFVFGIRYALEAHRRLGVP
jgi:unsaturated chondroitin disaccharide hydrolase